MFEVIKSNLENRGFKVSCFEDSIKAKEYIKESITGKSVGFGGSVTVEEMGLYEELQQNNEVFWHHRIPQGKTVKEMRDLANQAEVYISSVNGIAETGEIINIDATCNRIAAILYGHEKVYLIVGKNKIQPDYDSALWRARNIASPLNAKRLGRKTPCAVNADKCYDCKSPDRICRGLSVLWEKPVFGEYEIILINENLGY